LLNVIYEQKGNLPGGRVLFLLDEANSLGCLKVLENARAESRQFLISLVLLYQSFGQMDLTWGKAGREAWLDCTYYQAFSHLSDPDTIEEVSKMCGQCTAKSDSTSKSKSKHPWHLFS
jgi:type IV secretion system protein VirD4